jgi:L-2-hydroxyglutarate oxidase LhgO
MERVDVVVVGGGVSWRRENAARGLPPACSKSIRGQGWRRFAGSGEIHAGVYPGSLKGQLCVEGRRLLHAFCRVWRTTPLAS